MKPLLFILFFSVATISSAQESAVTEIRNYYTSIDKAIKVCKSKGDSCSLYNNLTITNAGDQSWRGSGSYKKEVQFWYDDSPQYCDECGKEGVNVLKKVISSEQTGLTVTYKEYLFKNGKLIFYFIQILGEQQTEEYRYYYKNDVLIKHLESGNTMNGDEAAKKFKGVILGKAKDLQKEFLLSFK